jgi:hypothetical protein
MHVAFPRNSSWHSSIQNFDMAKGCPTWLSPKLDFLVDSVVRDEESANELAIFGFISPFMNSGIAQNNSRNFIEDLAVSQNNRFC